MGAIAIVCVVAIICATSIIMNWMNNANEMKREKLNLLRDKPNLFNDDKKEE